VRPFRSLYVASGFALYWALTRSCSRADIWMLLGTATTIAAAIALACAGVSLAWSLNVLALAPWVTVIGYEVVGHRRNEYLIRAAIQADQR
jgi:hypothetical protein